MIDMETMLFLAGAFVAAEIGGLFLGHHVASDPDFDSAELSSAMIFAYLLAAIRNASAVGVIVGLVIFHQEIFAIAKTFVGWPS